jgi:hypothetical protein
MTVTLPFLALETDQEVPVSWATSCGMAAAAGC